ncbi:MAG: hypothetical protein H6737_07085 [Alphaproteobacteria bacterium]|nr:hypothetical protein [Alphaproteobacteria bacterium]
MSRSWPVIAALVALGCKGRVDTGPAEITVSLGSNPVIEALVPDPTRIDVGETTTLHADVWDPDDDPLAFDWVAGCDGTFDDPTSGEPAFTLATVPSDGLCVLSLWVTDPNGGEAEGAVQITTGPPVTDP